MKSSMLNLYFAYLHDNFMAKQRYGKHVQLMRNGHFLAMAHEKILQ